MKTYPNQKVIHIQKRTYEDNFLQVGNDEWQRAARELSGSAFKLYLYLAGNKDGFELALSQKAVEDTTGLSKNTYHRAVEELETNDCGDATEAAKPAASLLQRAIAHNYDLLRDSYIQTLIHREVESKFNGAKIGKLLCRGGYSFIVSDPVAQIQHIIRSHAVDGDHDIAVSGLIPAHEIYSAYWNRVRPAPDKVVPVSYTHLRAHET